MKKILAIVTMAAMVAGAFAVDVAAKAKMELHVLNSDKDTAGFTALGLDHGSEGWNPTLAFNANGDEAGASFKIYDKTPAGGSEFNMVSAGWNMWFSPLAGLKIKLGEMDYCLNQEHMEWDKSNSKIGAWQGVGLSYGANGISFDVMLQTGAYSYSQDYSGATCGYWFNNEAENKIGATSVKFGYSADFGTIAADYTLDGKVNTIGAAYAGNAAGWSFFVNAIIALDTTENADNMLIHPELYLDGKAGDIGIQLFVPITYAKHAWNWSYRPACGANKDGDVLVGTCAKVAFPAGSLNGYVYIECADWLADSLSVNVRPALCGAVGALGWEARFDANIAPKADKAFKFDVPVIFTLNY